MDRWCVYIDILGFSDLWEQDEPKAVRSLGELMRAVYHIGTKVYPKEGDRLFVHHMGDGIAILSEFREQSLERAIAIAVALMRCVVRSGAFASAAVAEGAFADVTGCYPKEVRDAMNDGGVVTLGAGLMTVSPVMGTAFIRAYRLNSEAPPGPFLVAPEFCRARIPNNFSVTSVLSKRNEALLSIDWVRAESRFISDIQDTIMSDIPSRSSIINSIKLYCRAHPHIRKKWRKTLQMLLQISL